jgi:hypothetical protein
MSLIPQNMAVQSAKFLATQLEASRCVERFFFGKGNLSRIFVGEI